MYMYNLNINLKLNYQQSRKNTKPSFAYKKMEEAVNNKGEDLEEKRESTEKRVFKAYNIILNENIIGEKIYIFLLMLQSIQIMISPIQIILDSSNSDVETVVDIIKLFNYAEYIISLNSLPSYLVAMGTQIAILLFVLICLAIMIKPGNHTDNSQNNSWKPILQTISTALTLFSTIFFIPSLQLYLTTILCHENGMSNIQCWSMSHLGIMFLGMFALCLHLCLTYSLTLFFVEDYLFSNIPWAGNNKSTNVLIFFGMLLCAIFSAFRSDISHEIGGYGVVVLMLLFLITIYYKYEYSITYNKRVQIGYFWQSGVVIAIIFGLLPTQYLDITYRYSTFGVSLLLGGTLAYALSCMYELKMKDLLFVSEKEIRTKKRMNEYLVHLTPLLDNLHMHRWNRYLLHGIRNNHQQFCQNILCPCQNSHNFIFNPNYRLIDEYREVALQFTELERIMDKAKISQVASPLQLWIAHIQANWYQFIELYIQQLITRQPRDIYLRLIDAYYKEYYLKNYYKSYYSLLQAIYMTKNIRKRFLIYRFTSKLDKNIKVYEANFGNKVELGGFVAFHEKNTRFQHNLRTCTSYVKDFWSNFVSDHLRVKFLFKLSGKISNLFRCIRVGYKELIKQKPTYIKSYSMYGNFLNMVIHTDTDAQQIIGKGEMMKRNSAIFAHCNKEEASYDINAKAIVIRISGSLDRLGDIISVNEWAFEISGYTPPELVVVNIRTIVPPFLAVNHDEYMLRFMRTGKRLLLGIERLVFIYTKVGYYDPIMLTIKTMAGLTNGLEFVAFIHKNQEIIRNKVKLPYIYSRLNPKINFISVSIEGNIIGLSKRCANVLGIPHAYFVRKNTLSNDVVPLSVLNPKMLITAKDSQLEHGLVIEINTEALLRYIDRDYIMPNEIDKMLENMGILEVYIQLSFVRFGDGSLLKSYSFLIIKKVRDIQSRSGQMLEIRYGMKETNISKGSPSNIQAVPDIAASVSVSSVSSSDLTINNMKRNLVLLQKPFIIKLFEYLLLSFGSLTILALIVAYLIFNWDLLVYFDLFDWIITRSVYFTQIITHFYMMLAAVNYNLPNTEYTNDISAYANQQLYTKIDQLSKVQFDITKVLQGELIAEDKKDDFKEQVDTKLLNPDFTYTVHHQDLDVTILQILTEIISLKDSYKNNLLKTNALEHNFGLYNSGEKVLNKGNRTPTFEEIQIFSILYNGADPHTLDYIHEMSEIGADFIYKFIAKREQILYIFGIIFPVVLLILIILLIVMHIKIQDGKKDFLCIFAEIPAIVVNEMIEHCQQFENEELESQKEKLADYEEDKHKNNHKDKEAMREEILERNIMEKTHNDNESISDDVENKQLLGENIAAQKAILFQDFHNNESDSEEQELEFRLDGSPKSEEINKSFGSDEVLVKNDNTRMEEQKFLNLFEEEENDAKKRKLERERKTNEEADKKEKKKKISSYSWGIDGISLLVLLLIGIIGTLKGGSNYIQMKVINTNGEMVQHLENQYDLILCLSYTLTFVLTYQQKMTPLPLLEGEDPIHHFQEYYGKSILAMEDVVHSKYKSSKLVDSLKSTLQNLFTPTYCEYVQNIIYISPAQCRTICSQTNSEGLKNALHYTSYILWQKYLNAQELVIRTEEWRAAQQSTDLVELYLNIEKVIIPTVEDMIQDSLGKIKNTLETQERMRFLILIIEIVVYIILLIIIEIFFVKLQQKEIFIFKGILNLIPLDLIRQNPQTKEQIYKYAKVFM